MTGYDLKTEFFTTSFDILSSIEESVLKLEKSDEQKKVEILNEIFRYFHTLKGNAKTVGLKIISDLSHKIENILDRLRKGEIKLTEEIVDTILFSKDVILDFCENQYEDKEKADEVIKKIDLLFASPKDELDYISPLFGYIKKIYSSLKIAKQDGSYDKVIINLYFTILDLGKFLKKEDQNNNIKLKEEIFNILNIFDYYTQILKEYNIKYSDKSFKIFEYNFYSFFKLFEKDILNFYNIKKIDTDLNGFLTVKLQGLSEYVIFNLINFTNIENSFFYKLISFKNTKEKILLCSYDLILYNRIRYFLHHKNLDKIYLFKDYKNAILEVVK